jgi:hypothetical protein
MIVGTIQREDDCSWQDASKSWLEQDREEEGGAYYVGTCQGVSNQPPEAEKKRSSGASCLPKKEEEDEEIMENSWWSPDPRELQVEEGEKDYFLELLMGGLALGGGERQWRGRLWPAARRASRPKKQQPRRVSQPRVRERGGAMGGPPRKEASQVPKRGKKRLVYRVEGSQRRGNQAAGARRYHLTSMAARDPGTK